MIYSFVFLMLAPALFGQSSSRVDWARYLSGDRSGNATSVAIDRDGGIWVAGSTTAQFDAPGPNTPFQTSPKGGLDVYVAKYERSAGGQLELKFWTWIGGSGRDEVRAMALDSLGRVYLTGITDSLDFPAEGFFLTTTNSGGIDSWVAVINPTFTGKDSMIFATMYGGTGTDVANAITTDSAFNIYITGYTTSLDLPKVLNAAQNSPRGTWETFMVKFNPSQVAPVSYATYFGGNSTDVATGIAVDSRGIVWFTGYTASTDFPIYGNSYHETAASFFDGFLVGLDISKTFLDAIVYSSYIGGNGADYPKAMKIAPDDTLWITGYTYSTDLPVSANAVQGQYSGNADGFVMALDPQRPKDQLVRYATYLGGGDGDVAESITLLGGGRIAVSGYTASGNFPVTGGGLQRTLNGASVDGFVTVFDSTASGFGAIEYSTYLGGKLNDVLTGVAVDAANGLYVSGYTNSSDFPNTNGQTPALTSGFLVRIARE